MNLYLKESRQQNLECILLKKKTLLGKDVILTLFTKKLGKINVFAKGVKKIISKRLSYLQTGNLLRVEVYFKSNKFYLKEVSLISAFSELKSDLNKIKLLYAFFYILDKFLPTNNQDLQVYELTKKVLIRISKNNLKRKEFYKTLSTLLFYFGFVSKSELSEEEIEKVIYEHINIKVASLMI